MADAIEAQPTIKLIRSNDKSDSSVLKYVTEIAQKESPLLAWADPVPTARNSARKPGRYVGFNPLAVGVPNWPENLPLAEARLFWANAALHIVANEGAGCRWARIEEAANNEVSQGEAFSRSEIPILTLRDRDRFGLTESDDDEMNLVAVEYRQQGRLMGWRLVMDKQP